MNIIKVKDSQAGGKKAFELLAKDHQDGTLHVIGLATGSTPLSLYKELVQSDLDFSKTISVNLDEYVGLAASDPQSYDYFMHKNLFNQKPFKHSYLPNGLATDEKAECARYDRVIAEHPLDVQVLGIGQNGHIGFNEPGASFDSTTRKVKLTESTIEANKRFFERKEDVPTYAYSMGIRSIMQSKKIILLAYGESKAQAIKSMIEEPVSENCPASALQQHDNVIVIVDEAAASLLGK